MGFEDSDELLAEWLARSGGAAAKAASGQGRLWPEGRAVGAWIVAGFLGRGGSAEVYCARHCRLGTAAVLKVLWRDGDGPRERFLRETRFLMESGGGPFPAFFGEGEEDGRPWMAMELLDEYPAPSTDAGVAAYLLDVAGAVEALHRLGWIHRDLKPRNILRRSDGHAVLADFGLLKKIAANQAAETASERGSPSIVDGREVGVGTPGYAAPEQFAGGAATPATDVHALGILADECFGGKPPRAWDRIIRRATGSLPRLRYESAAAMASAIRRRHWRRNGAYAALASAMAFTLAAATLVRWRGSHGQPIRIALSPGDGPASPSSATSPGVVPAPSVTQTLGPSSESESQVVPPTHAWAGIRAERSAALARFEADESKKEIIRAMLDDMRKTAGRMDWVPTWRGVGEVTQKQWMALMDDNPSRFQGDDLPVDSVTPGACFEFLERLNRTSVAREEVGRKFRLPTVEEWTGAVSRQLPETQEELLKAGWFAENAGGRTHPVGEKAEGSDSADLFGNVRELTQSWGRSDGREGFLCMGGCWSDSGAEPWDEFYREILEQPRYIQSFTLPYSSAYADPGVATLPGDYPYAVCPEPGKIGFRLWAEPLVIPERPNLTRAAREHWEEEENKR